MATALIPGSRTSGVPAVPFVTRRAFSSRSAESSPARSGRKTGLSLPTDEYGTGPPPGGGPAVRFKGFGWKDYSDLIIHAHSQLGGPIVLVWDNLRMHLVAPLREFFEANADWLTVFQLPTYAPDLNPQDGIWSLVKRDIGNLAAADLSQITRAVKRNSR
nr:transposase [Streptomyces olivochromogenes]